MIRQEQHEGKDATLPPSSHEHFLSLLEAHQRLLLKVCWTYGNSAHDRDDLFQEIVGRLWAAFGRYDQHRKFSTWMYRVALNVAIDFRRKQRRHTRETQRLEDNLTATRTARVQRGTEEEQLCELHELLKRQTGADRAILLLYLEGNSYREIGEVMGVSESNVGTRLSRIRKSLRESVQGHQD